MMICVVPSKKFTEYSACVREAGEPFWKSGSIFGGFEKRFGKWIVVGNWTTSARMTKLILDFGLHETFANAAERFALHHGCVISENLVRLVVERVGDIATKKSDARSSATCASHARCCQAIGCRRRFNATDAWRRRVARNETVVARGEHCTSAKPRGHITEARFVARMTGVETFRRDLTRILSLERARECKSVAFLGDGAPWIWNMAAEICPNAVQILDFMHAIVAASKPVENIFIVDKHMMSIWTETISKQLKAGRVLKLIAQLEQCAFVCRGEQRAAFATAAKYSSTNNVRMRYDVFLAHGMPIGSGMIESAHRYVLQSRMKRAGQHWDPIRADRLSTTSRRIGDYGPGKLYDAIAA